MGELNDWISLALAFVSGSCVALWRLFTVFNRVSLVEKDVLNLDEAVKELKTDLNRVEDKIAKRLESIEQKIDKLAEKQ